MWGQRGFCLELYLTYVRVDVYVSARFSRFTKTFVEYCEWCEEILYVDRDSGLKVINILS